MGLVARVVWILVVRDVLFSNEWLQAQSADDDNTPDFVELITQISNFVSNDRIKSYNDGVDSVLEQARAWMTNHGIAYDDDQDIGDLLDEIRDHIGEAVRY